MEGFRSATSHWTNPASWLGSEHWLVELALGGWGRHAIVKPRCTRVSELTADEAAELGPLRHRSAAFVDELVAPEQVYTALGSDAGGVPVHIHYVVQPVTRVLMDDHAAHGRRCRVAMFTRGGLPHGWAPRRGRALH